MTYSLSFSGIKQLLEVNGYTVYDNPHEQRPPNVIQLEYKADMRPEDVNVTMYMFTHKVIVSWATEDPSKIRDQLVKIVGIIGAEFMEQYHFEMGDILVKKDHGTMQIVSFVVSWKEFLALGVGIIP